MRSCLTKMAPIAVLGLLLSCSAVAQTVPTTLLAGTMFGTGVFDGNDNIDCQVEGPGISVFQRTASGPAKIGFPKITYDIHANNATTYYLGGLATLKFSTATSGTITFQTGGSNGQTPSNIAHPKFSGYAQSWNATTKTLTVQLTINLPVPTGSTVANVAVPLNAVYLQ